MVIAIVNHKSLRFIRRFIVVSLFVIALVVGLLLSMVMYYGLNPAYTPSPESCAIGETIVFRFGLPQALASIVFLALSAVVLLVSSVFIFRNHFVQIAPSTSTTETDVEMDPGKKLQIVIVSRVFKCT